MVDCIRQRWLSLVSLIPLGLLEVSSWCSSHWAVRSMSLPREQGQTFVIVSTHRVLWWYYVTSKYGWYKSYWRKNVLREMEISSWVIEKWKAENGFGNICPALSKEYRPEVWQITFLTHWRVRCCEVGNVCRASPWFSKTIHKTFYFSFSVSVSTEKHTSWVNIYYGQRTVIMSLISWIPKVRKALECKKSTWETHLTRLSVFPFHLFIWTLFSF